jgi:hypothetical protein
MNPNIEYAEETVDKIIDLLTQWSNGFFKHIFNGDPGEIATDQMPCLIIEHLGTKVAVDMTGLDTLVETIDIGVVLNKRADLVENNSNPDIVRYKQQARQLMQGISNSNAQYDTTSILGVLRIHFTLGDYAFDQIQDIHYGDVPRNANSDELTSYEGHAMCTISHHQSVPQRT